MTRLAVIEKEKCNPQKCGDYLCARLCPVNRTGKECITKEKKAVISEELCTGCGICPRKCPFEAIHIINLPEKVGEPIHRYSVNSFELFGLPIPKKGAVVGIIGRNGIGKSTSLAILSGELKPNLGNYKNPPAEEEIIKKYSTVFLGTFFKNLYNKKIKIAYKPQRVELLSKVFKGKVKDLIKKIDEKNLGEDLLKELNLEHLKKRDISKLSGGELQRLAIVATSIKKADFYFFDEPASFCDVTSRIKIARLIRSLSKDSSVIVVEHDLATLDYISDEIQIIYGEPAAYGVISQSKGVRRGINEYLDGFLPDDNIRFRNYEIKFSDIAKSEISSEILFKFPKLKKSFETFSLEVDPGEIHMGEVLAVMGANGLGKTTFLKLLAGLEKPDYGKLEKQKISYKPQYLEVIKGSVLEILKKVAKEKFSSGWYKQNILEKLGLRHILNSEIKNLSGGELQKLHIAIALSKNCDIYALDEPSAFIDVEDRLNVAGVIKNFVKENNACAIVVDHDVQFIDYMSDSMLVFSGEPGKKGEVYGPCSKVEGMNKVLKILNITYRKDPQNFRGKINKPGSQLDIEQRKKGQFYYT